MNFTILSLYKVQVLGMIIDILLYVLMAVICYFIAGFIHELGHVIVGLLNGWKFYMLVIGPLGVKLNEENKIVCYFEREKMLWGGVGGTFPQEDSTNNIKIWGKILLGGPIISIIMGIVILPIGISLDNLFLILLGAIPFGMGITCLIPMKTGIFYTDGGRWIRLHKKGKENLEEMALFNFTQNEMLYNNYTRVDYKDILVLLESENSNIRYYGNYCGYKYYKEKNDTVGMERIKTEMENMQKKVPQFIVNSCKID